MKDITKTALDQNSISYENYVVDDAIVKNILDHVLAQAIQDLYEISYDIKELQESNGSSRKIKYAQRELKDILEYFDSPFYTAHVKTPKTVWFKWVASMLKKPRANIGDLVNKMFIVA